MLRESAVTEDDVFPIKGGLALDPEQSEAARKKSRRREDAPVTLTLAPSAPAARKTVLITSDLPATNRFKRLFDVATAGSLLVLTSPLMLVVAVLVRLSSPGPIILQQRRLTQDGKEFAMFKFRSMRSDAESKSGPVLAQQNDSRVTPIGRFIRMTRLDELPQLVNVLRNEMSLIGPRPERPEIAEQLRREIPNFDQRLRVKAGLTGLAQVEMGYSSCTSSYRRKVALDRLYVRRQSLILDCWIAFRTVWVMFTGRGAR